MKIRNRLIILFSLIAMAPLLVIGLVSYFNAKNTLEQQILSGLESVADSRISDITHLIQLRQEQCKELAGTFLPRQLESNGENDSATITRIQAHIESIYEEMKLDPGSKASDINKPTAIDIIGIWDIEGTIVANTNTDLIGQKMPGHYLQGVKENGSYFAGFQTDPLTGKDYMIWLQAIRDYEDNQFAGAVLFKVKAQILNDITTRRAGLGKTGEIFIGQLDGNKIRFITQLRHTESSPEITIGSDVGLLVQYAVQGKDDIGISTDYRGAKVLFVYKYLPDMKWGIVAKMDIAEAYAPVYALRSMIILIGLSILGFSILIAIRFAISFSRPIAQAVKVANDVAQGDIASEINIRSGAIEINELGAALAGMQRNMQEVSAVAVAASGGDYDQSVEVRSEKDQLAMSINKMMATTKEKLWMEKGIGETAIAFRGENEIQIIAKNVINQLVPYLQAQVGALYVFDEDEVILKFMAGYAFKKKGRTNYDIQVGEGLAGQAAKEHKLILFTDVPEDYLKVNSALGESTPKNIIAVPLVTNEQLKGVMEIGSVNEFTEVQQQLLQNIAENIAIAISTAESRNKIQELLEETKAQNEELQASEEELQAQQTELEQANTTLEENAQLMEEKNLSIQEHNQKLQEARRKLETKAEELEMTSKYKSEFLANMSHELRTPLNSILLLSRLMADNAEANLTKDQVEYAEVIHHSGEGLLELISEILDLSKIETGKMKIEIHEVEIAQVNKTMVDTFGPLTQKKEITFKVDVNSKVPKKIPTDRLRLEQLLKNLLSNAVKFTPVKGKIHLKVFRPGKSVKYQDAALQDKSVIAFAVSDTGIGIPRDKLDLVFKAFRQADGSTQRKFGGTGLGLSISREIAKLLGGELVLESTEGKGSTFTVYLPETGEDVQVAKEEAPEVLVIPDEIPDDRNKLKKDDKPILIIEDDPHFAESLMTFTHKRGYKAVVAVSGDKGIEYARKYKPIGILLGIKLPVKNGWEVMKELKDDPETFPIPVHIISSLDAREKGIESGAVDFIPKAQAEGKLDAVFDNIERITGKEVKSILIIEDNEIHSEALKNFLQTNNTTWNIFTAADAKEGSGILRKEDIDCLILDMELPDASGYDILQKIRKEKRFKSLPVIVYTGKSLSEEEEKKIRKYASAVVIKTARSYERLVDELSLFLHVVSDSNKVSRPTKPYEKKTALKGKKVLLVDDDLRNIFALSSSLEKQGMEVISASNGKEALEELKKDDAFHIVLMDIMMPVMDGYESMTEIRNLKKFKNLPIIAVTAKAMSNERKKCIKAGASDYISKPVDIDQLISLLRIWLFK